MQSSGGVTRIDDAIADAAGCLLSGPAGGVVGAAYVGSLGGYRNLLSFDMGGTSTDVAPVLEGEAQTTTEKVVAGAHQTAHGGCALGERRRRLHRVGRRRRRPARRSPFCWCRARTSRLRHGRRGPDRHRRQPVSWLPRRRGEARRRSVAQARALGEGARFIGERLGLDAEEAALGIVRVADAEMVRALRVISVERGLDPREFALLAFGGAGGMHACSLAEELGMETVLIPARAAS